MRRTDPDTANLEVTLMLEAKHVGSYGGCHSLSVKFKRDTTKHFYSRFECLSEARLVFIVAFSYGNSRLKMGHTAAPVRV